MILFIQMKCGLGQFIEIFFNDNKESICYLKKKNPDNSGQSITTLQKE